MMTTFDAPNREVCTVQRENTNTPLQSLVLLNDPQFVEAAKALAQRMQIEGGRTIEAQIGFAFRAVTSRQPTEEEIKLLKALYQDQLIRFTEKPKEAQAFLEVGEFKMKDELRTISTASLAIVSNTILNHDEAYMKR